MTDSSAPSYTTLIRDMPEGERPRERLAQYGADTLSNARADRHPLAHGHEG